MSDYRYAVMPMSADPQIGWTVRLYAKGKLVGGRVFPARDYLTNADSHAAANRAAHAAGAEWSERMGQAAANGRTPRTSHHRTGPAEH